MNTSKFFACSLFLFACLICFAENPSDNKTVKKDFMPFIEDDVLWVQSIPPGANVYILKKQKGQRFPLEQDSNNPPMQMKTSSGSEELSQHTTGPFSGKSAGTTPLEIKVSPGIYCIGIQLDVSSENIPWKFGFFPDSNNTKEVEAMEWLTKPKSAEIYVAGDANVGLNDLWDKYLTDGNLEMWGLANNGFFKKVGKTYEVEKKKGKTATVIALFQRKDQDTAKIYESFKENYKSDSRGVEPQLFESLAGVSNDKAGELTKRLLRGGKVLITEGDASLLCELTPIEREPNGASRQGGLRFIKVGEFPKK
jgi:hypothetical protein